PIGMTSVHVTLTTPDGDIAQQCNFNVVVTDSQPAQLVCPHNITVGNDAGQCGALVTYDMPMFVDNCPMPPDWEILCSPASGSFFHQGMTTVTCAVFDGSDVLQTQCSFTVTVNDTEPPTVTCPPDRSVTIDPGQCTASVPFSATAHDN